MEEKDVQTFVEAVRAAFAPEFQLLREGVARLGEEQQQAIAVLRQEIAGVRDELRQEIAGVRDELRQAVADLQRQIAGLTARVANLERELAGLSEDVVQPFIQMVSADKKQKDGMLAHLDRQLTYLGTTATNTSTQLDFLSRNWRETADKTILVHKRVEALEARLSENGAAELRETVAALTERVARLEKSVPAAKKRAKPVK